MHEATFVLPLPPSVNEAYASVIKYTKAGKPYPKRISSEALENYRRGIQGILQEQHVIHPAWGKAKRLGYEAYVYVCTNGSDLSNRQKVFEDILQDTLDFNDNKIVEVHCYKRIDAKVPRIEARLYIVE